MNKKMTMLSRKVINSNIKMLRMSRKVLRKKMKKEGELS